MTRQVRGGIIAIATLHFLPSITGQVSPTQAQLGQTESGIFKTQFAATEQMLQKAPPLVRSFAVPRTALLAFFAGAPDKAMAYASEALALSRSANPDQGVQIYYGNEVLGLLAIQRGDITGAKTFLYASATSAGSKEISQFGLNVRLAADLLAKGETTAVIDFFEKSKRIWPSGEPTLRSWQILIRGGVTPDFGRYLVQP